MKLKIIFLFIIVPLIARDIYFTRSGKVSFFSATPIEDIKANNNQTTCVLDLETGDVSFRIPILGFNFPNSLRTRQINIFTTTDPSCFNIVTLTKFFWM